jgi:hypothetical protein
MLAGKFFHYSKKGIKKLNLRKAYRNQEFLYYNKPRGLWLSVEGEYGWEQWCKEEGFRIERLTYKHSVVLREDAKIIKLTTDKKIKQFSKKYAINWPQLSKMRVHCINWPEVAKDYQGILLTKYWNEYWMKYPWIYSWDCVSACIWDLSCIKKFELLPFF